MLSLGALSFAVPLALAALITLPLLWWLLRAVPPAPQRIDFPPLRLLTGLLAKEETPAHTPLWLLLLRMLAAALLIFGISHPIWNLTSRLPGSGPLILAVDNGWTAATDWAAKLKAMQGLIDEAARTSRPVAVLPAITDPASPSSATGLTTAEEARRLVGGLTPFPWKGERSAITDRLDGLTLDGSANVVWIADGVGQEADRNFAERLQRAGSLRLLLDDAGQGPLMLLPPSLDGADITLTVRRTTITGDATVVVRAVDADGQGLGLQTLNFVDGESETSAAFSLPTDLRNRIARLEIQNRPGAGSVALTDDRWRRRPVGLIATSATDTQPLLGARYYLRKALDPFSEIREGDYQELIDSKLSVLILPDYAGLTETDQSALDNWLRAGGVMIRFAGPALARQPDSLLPVTLRSGGRSLGGAMSWSRPTGLAPLPGRQPLCRSADPGRSSYPPAGTGRALAGSAEPYLGNAG